MLPALTCGWIHNLAGRRGAGMGMTPQDKVESAIRGPQSYPLAKYALELMERAKVWPTPLNFELWLHVAGDSQGDLAAEIDRLLAAGSSITEEVSEELATRYLPKQRLNEEIRDTGDQLSRELSSVSDAIRMAKQNHEVFGRTLATAGADIDAALSDPDAIRATVGRLANATRTVHEQNTALERRLADSTAEVGRLKEHLEQVRRDATTDSLTNLANRKAFDDELEKALAEADAGGEALALAVLDIDHFKHFNDSWGHQTGDQVIRFVASVIGRAAAPPSFAARYGGEEFAIIFPGEHAKLAPRVLEEIRGEIASRALKRRSTNDDLGQITISGGYALRVPGETAEFLMERADAALYTSKRLGRNRNTKSETPPKSKAA